jgi:hypothetical protein
MFSKFAKELGEIGVRSGRLKPVVSAIDLTTRDFHSTETLRMPYGAVVESREFSEELKAKQQMVGPFAPVGSKDVQTFSSEVKKSLYNQISTKAEIGTPPAIPFSPFKGSSCVIFPGC